MGPNPRRLAPSQRGNVEAETHRARKPRTSRIAHRPAGTRGASGDGLPSGLRRHPPCAPWTSGLQPPACEADSCRLLHGAFVWPLTRCVCETGTGFSQPRLGLVLAAGPASLHRVCWSPEVGEHPEPHILLPRPQGGLRGSIPHGPSTWFFMERSEAIQGGPGETGKLPSLFFRVPSHRDGHV